MKSFRILVCFFLPVVLLVSAAPRQDTQNTKTQNLHFDTNKVEVDTDGNLVEVLEADPSIIHQIDPDLVRSTALVDVEVDKHVMLEMLRRLMEEEEKEEKPKETDEGESYNASVSKNRRKRQTVLSGDVNVDKQRGGRRITGTLNVDHALNSKHSIGGSLGIDHTKISGLGSSTDYNAGLKYSFNPNKRTSLSLGASRNWGSSGRGTNFGVNFSHTFGRKKRSADRLKIKCRSNEACKVKARGRRLR